MGSSSIPTTPARRPRSGWVAFGAWGWGWLVLLGACGGGEPPVPEPVIIARLESRTVTLPQFQAYVDRHSPAAPSPRLRSRLLDQFLDELLVWEYARRHQWLEAGEEDPAASAGVTPRRYQRFIEELVYPAVAVTPAEMEAYYAAHPGNFTEGGEWHLATLVLGDREVAQELLADLRRKRRTFAEATEAYALGPEQGRERAYRPEDLPEAIAEAVAGMKENEVRLVEVHAQFHLVRLVRRTQEKHMSYAEAEEHIRLQLLQEKSEAERGQALLRLREEYGLQVFYDRLGFPYTNAEAE